MMEEKGRVSQNITCVIISRMALISLIPDGASAGSYLILGRVIASPRRRIPQLSGEPSWTLPICWRLVWDDDHMRRNISVSQKAQPDHRSTLTCLLTRVSLCHIQKSSWALFPALRPLHPDLTPGVSCAWTPRWKQPASMQICSRECEIVGSPWCDVIEFRLQTTLSYFPDLQAGEFNQKAEKITCLTEFSVLHKHIY